MSKDKISTMTKLVLEFNNILNLFLTLAPYIFIFTTILGIFLLIYGIIKWKNLQKEV